MTSNESDQLAAAPLDVQEIDSYLLRLLVPRFHSILTPIGVHLPRTHAKAILLAVTMWLTLADTPATLALGLRVKDNSLRRVLAYVFLASLLPGLYQQLDTWYDSALLTQETRNMSSIEIRALSRKRYLAQRIIAALKIASPLLQLTVLLCWWAAATSAPTTSMMLTGISFSRTRFPRDLNVTYAHRRWIYELIVRSFELTSPVRSFDHLRTIVNSMFSPVRALVTRMKGQQDEDHCALCKAQPVVVPCFTDCNHLYCYSCLWTALAQNVSFSCRRCGQPVTRSMRSQASAILQ